MITLGIVLLIVSIFAGVPMLQSLGVLFLLGSMGRSVGGRRHYW